MVSEYKYKGAELEGVGRKSEYTFFNWCQTLQAAALLIFTLDAKHQLKLNVRILVIGCCLIALSSCRNYDYNVSSFQTENVKFKDLPKEVKYFLTTPSEYMEVDSQGYSETKSMVCLQCSRYKFETIETFIGPWISYYKMTDVSKGVSYRIDYGMADPFIVYNNVLFIPKEYNILSGNLDSVNLEFSKYLLN